MDKKGVSSIIAYVLLIGFMITLAIIVTLWMREQAENSVEDILDYECQIGCDDVFISGCYDSGNVKISNRGNFNINGIVLKYGGNNLKDNTSISVNEEKSLISPLAPVYAVPVLMNNERECVCGAKQIKIEECK